MLPLGKEQPRVHKDGGAEILQRFMSDNPLLKPVEWDGRGTLCDGFWHFAFLSHREYSSGMGSECCYRGAPDNSCLTDHPELWQHTGTGDLVHIAHPYCEGKDQGFKDASESLYEKGLGGLLHESSWYYPEHSRLVVIAVPETLALITVEEAGVLRRFGEDDVWSSRRNIAMRHAVEDVDSQFWLAAAHSTAECGDSPYAAILFADSAHTERTGRFHRQAVGRLRHLGALLRDNYNEVVRVVIERSFLTNHEVRQVFKFAELEFPEGLAKVWRNQGRGWSWGYRELGIYGSEGYREEYRCVICEEWMLTSEGINMLRGMGHQHKNIDCFAEVLGFPERVSEQSWHSSPKTDHSFCSELKRMKGLS